MDYSAVMITNNRREKIAKTIESVLRQNIVPKEFIIIDNGSTDGTVECILKYKQKYPFFKIYQTKEDPGVCSEINFGVKIATSPIILILDDDAILVGKNWMEKACKNLRENIGLVWGNPSGILDNSDYGEFFLGCAFVVRKSVFQEIGLFDEKFFIYENDTDLVIRIHRHGYRVLALKKMNVIHPYGPRGTKYYKYALSNRILMYWKYYPYWVAVIMTILHSFRELREIKDLKLIKYWLIGIRRFFSNLYWIGLSYKKRMGLKEFFRSSYQLRFPIIGYKLVKYIYHLAK